MKALLICNRPAVQVELESRLVAGGFTVRCHDHSSAAAECDRSEWPALVVLDCFDGDAWDICRRIRAQPEGNLAIIWVVVETNDSPSQQTALDAGADACLPWPPESPGFGLQMAAAIRQITALQELPLAKEALREIAERLSLAERGAHAGAWDARPQGRPLDSPETPVWYSPGMKELFGFSDEEFPNVLASWMSRVHPDEVQPVVQSILRGLEEKSQFEMEYRLLTKNQGYRWFNSRGHAILDREGRIVRVTGTVRDITENRRVADALQVSEAKWRSLVENAPDTITVVDLAGTIQFTNRDWPGVAGARSSGGNLVELTPEERRESIRAVLQEVARTGRPDRFELTFPGADGRPIWYGSRVGPIHGTEGINALVIITTNITTRKRHEEALHQEQDLLRRLLDLHERDRQLVAYEIHDGLTQEMTAALMHLQAFQHVAAERLEGTDFDRGLSLLRQAVQEARRLISGLRPPVLDELGIVAAIEYLVHEIQPDVPSIRFVHHTKFVRLAPPLESAVFRIAEEALSNIRAHSGSRRAKIELLEHGQHLRLVVRDWGKGFDPAEVHEGRFGLQGIRQRVRLLGAKVVIESQPGEGTMVIVDFPLILNRSDDGSERGAGAKP